LPRLQFREARRLSALYRRGAHSALLVHWPHVLNLITNLTLAPLMEPGAKFSSAFVLLFGAQNVDREC
jgi:hypothetical protein